MVQLSNGTKGKYSEVVDKCLLEMDGLFTCENLNIFPLGFYDVFIGMDWLEAQKFKLDCYNKTFECINEEGKLRIVKGIPKVVSIKWISPLQLNKFFRQDCQLYVAYVLDRAKNEVSK